MWILGLKGLKECFCTWDYAVLMIPNEDETAVHGCHARVIWMCACVRYWPYSRVGTCATVLKLVLLATHLPFTSSPLNCPSPSLHPCTLHTLLKMQIVKLYTLFQTLGPESHTLFSPHTRLFRPNKGLPPPGCKHPYLLTPVQKEALSGYVLGVQDKFTLEQLLEDGSKGNFTCDTK